MRNLPTLPGTIAKRSRLLCVHAAALLLVVLMSSGGSSAYSVLTHEEIVDLVWADQIRPLLLQRYWLKAIALLRKLRHRGVCKVDWIFTFACAAYNLVRMRNLTTAVLAV
jgi:hypothetical protein